MWLTVKSSKPHETGRGALGTTRVKRTHTTPIEVNFSLLSSRPPGKSTFVAPTLVEVRSLVEGLLRTERTLQYLLALLLLRSD